MANIKISELNEITKSQTAYNDYLPIVDSSANETKKISVENLTANNVYLLAVVKPNGQVPTPVAGAKYYNEVRNKIYYAPDDEHWYEYGTPVEGIFYIVLGEKGNYAYDSENEKLVSVGGGSGSEIVIGDEEPTEDTKMIIDTDAFEPQYSDITNEYSEASNMAYSCDYMNNHIQGDIITNGDGVKCGYKIDGNDVYIQKIQKTGSYTGTQITDIGLNGKTIVEFQLIGDSNDGHFVMPYINPTSLGASRGFYLNTSNSLVTILGTATFSALNIIVKYY